MGSDSKPRSSIKICSQDVVVMLLYHMAISCSSLFYDCDVLCSYFYIYYSSCARARVR